MRLFRQKCDVEILANNSNCEDGINIVKSEGNISKIFIPLSFHIQHPRWRMFTRQKLLMFRIASPNMQGKETIDRLRQQNDELKGLLLFMMSLFPP